MTFAPTNYGGLIRRKRFASSGNRTRAARVAGEHSTTEPTMLDIVEENKTEAAGNLAKLN